MRRQKYLKILLTTVIISFIILLSLNYYRKQLIYRNINLLKSFSAHQQEEAVSNLVKIGKPAVEPLIFAMKFDAVHAGSQVMKFAERILKKNAIHKSAAEMKEESNNLKCGAAKALGLIGDPKAIDPLISLLNYGNYKTDFKVRDNAVTALGKFGKQAVPPLTNTANSSNFHIRIQAVRALGLTKDPDAIEPIIKTFKNNFSSEELPYFAYNDDMGEAFVEAMGNLGKHSVNPLIIELNNEKNTIKYFIIKALGRTKDPEAVKPLVEYLKQTDLLLWDIAAESLAEIGKPAVSNLIQMLTHRDSAVQVITARILGEIRDPEAINPLVKLLESEDPFLRLEVLYSLMQYKDEKLIPVFIKCFRDDDQQVRKFASTALSVMGEPAVALLLKEMQSDSQSRYDQAFTALIRIKDQKALETLKKELKSADPEYRDDIEYIMLQIAANNITTKYQIKYLKNDNVLIRRNAAYQLGVYENSEAVMPLIAALKDKDQEVRLNSITSLGLIGDARAVEPLMGLLKDKSDSIGESAVTALRSIGGAAAPVLINNLREKDEKIRLRAYTALSKSAKSKVVEELAKAYRNDNDVNFRLEMMELIESSSVHPGRDIMKEALSDRDWRIRESALECLLRFPGEDYSDIVMTKLDDKKDEVRISAARALGVWRNQDSLSYLIKAFDDKNWKVRLAVVNALVKFRNTNTNGTIRKALQDEKQEIRKAAFRYFVMDFNFSYREEIISALKKDPEFALNYLDILQSMNIDLNEKAIAKELEKNGSIDAALTCLYSNNAELEKAAKKWLKDNGHSSVLELKKQFKTH